VICGGNFHKMRVTGVLLSIYYSASITLSTFPEFRKHGRQRQSLSETGREATGLLGSMMLFGLLVNLFQVHSFEKFLLNDEIVALPFGKMAQEPSRPTVS